MKDPNKIDDMVAKMSKKHADNIAEKKKKELNKKKSTDNTKKHEKEEIMIIDEWDTSKKK